MSALKFPGYHSLSYSSRTLSPPAKTTLVQQSLSHRIHCGRTNWEAPQLQSKHLHAQTREMMLEEKSFFKKELVCQAQLKLHFCFICVFPAAKWSLSKRVCLLRRTDSC